MILHRNQPRKDLKSWSLHVWYWGNLEEIIDCPTKYGVFRFQFSLKPINWWCWLMYWWCIWNFPLNMYITQSIDFCIGLVFPGAQPSAETRRSRGDIPPHDHFPDSLVQPSVSVMSPCFPWWSPFWLVVDLPLWKILVSWERIIPYIMENEKCSKPHTHVICLAKSTIWFNLSLISLMNSL
jgi:hypothetical protein